MLWLTYDISVNHNARNYKKKNECKVCKKRHPKFLHGYKAERKKVKQPGGDSLEESKVIVNCARPNTGLLLLVCV